MAVPDHAPVEVGNVADPDCIPPEGTGKLAVELVISTAAYPPAEVSSVPPRLAEYGVTLAEAQVALLSADGESQREIAAYLRKSSRTVENQLASVRRKLDAPTASAMAAIVARAVDLPAHGPSKGEAPESAPGSDR